ncbi:MAG: sigma-70 family RNA polymerase sigma factor [Planctomycetaceae bacterium]
MTHRPEEPDTSHGLLSRVRRDSADGWSRFVQIYSPLVLYWAKRAGLQDTDAHDVTQNVFRSVMRAVNRYERRTESTFRAWLWTISRNEIRGWYRSQQKEPLATGGSENRFDQVPAWIESDEIPDEPNVRAELIQRAAQAIQGDFQQHTWQCFWRAVVNDESPADIASDLGISGNAARQAKFRVIARLRDYVELD